MVRYLASLFWGAYITAMRGPLSLFLAEIALCRQRIKNAETLFLKARIDQQELEQHIHESQLLA